jgi:hypothetical protein
MKTLCRSWLLILILFGWFSPSLDAQTATVIPDTEAARHIGLSRGLAKIATDREEAWRGRWLPYYRELGIDPEIPVTRVDIPSLPGLQACQELHQELISEKLPHTWPAPIETPSAAILAGQIAAGGGVAEINHLVFCARHMRSASATETL